MTVGSTLFVFGVLLVLTPVFGSPLNMLDYCAWLAKQPLNRIFQFRYCVVGGMLIAAAGAMLDLMH